MVGEGAAPSRHANLAFSGVYKTPPHGWCYPPFRRVVLSDRSSQFKDTLLQHGSLANLQGKPRNQSSRWLQTVFPVVTIRPRVQRVT